MLVERPKIIKVKTPNEFLRFKIAIFGDGIFINKIYYLKILFHKLNLVMVGKSTLT